MKDAAAKIAATEYSNIWPTEQAALARKINTAIRRAVKAERERCVGIILESDTPGTPGKYERQYMLEAIIEKINTPAKKGIKRKRRR